MECSNIECAYWVHGDCFGLSGEQDVPKRFKCHVCDPKGSSRLVKAKALSARVSII